jgi:zinc protease
MAAIDVRWSRRRPARWAWALIFVASFCPTVLHAESIDRVVLPSGLTVVIAEQHTTQVVEVRVAVRAGPVYEGERLGSGLSLLTQRLIVAGGVGDLTPPLAREALAKLGAQLSGTTASARSDFALTTTAANLAPALTLIANRLATPLFIAEDLERERAALATSEPSPEQAALMGLLLRQHPARLPVGGLPPLRGALTLDHVQAYHQARYRSANTVVVVCGNIAGPEARRLVEQTFASYPFGGYAPQALPIEPPPLASRYQAITSALVKQPKVTIAWRTETLDHPTGPGLAVLASWLGGEHGVLATALSAKGLVQDIVVENVTAISAPGYLRLSFSTTPERRAEAEQTLYKALEAIGQNPLDEAQIAAARVATLRQIAQRQSTVHGWCDDLLAWELAAGDPAYVRRFSEQIAEVDGIEVMRELRRYVLSREGDRGRCTLVVRPPDTKPAKSTEPARPPTPVSVVAPEIVTLPHGVRLMLVCILCLVVRPRWRTRSSVAPRRCLRR